MAAYSHMDEVFRALADPSRRLLLDSLNERNGQTLRELGSRLDMARQSVSKHLAVLEAANLITTVRRGREKHHYLNAAPINEIAERWITRYDQDRVHALADLKRALEDTPDGQALVRLHDLHPDHARTALAGADRAGVHRALLGTHVRLRLEARLDHDLAHARPDDRRPRAGRASSPSPTAGSPTPGTRSRPNGPSRWISPTTPATAWSPSRARRSPSRSSRSASR